MQRKTILMFLYGPIETDGRVQRSIKAIKELPVDIILVTCGSNKDYIVEGVKKHYDFYDGKGSVVYMKFLIRSFILSLRLNRQIDIFYLHDYFSTVFAFFVRLLRKPFIYDAHELIVKRKTDKRSFRDKLFIWAEKCNARYAQTVIEANKEREKVLRRIYKLKHTTYVLNITDYKILNYENDNCRDKIIVYQGAVTSERNLSFFINALTQIDDNYKLMIIGDGTDLIRLKELSKNLCIDDRVIFTGRLSNVEMLNLLKRCMVGIITYPFTSLNTVYCSPNKIFEYASINLPMLSTNQPFIAEVFSKYKLGETFHLGDIKSFVYSFNKVIKNYSSYRQQMHDFLSDYSWDGEKEKIKHCIKVLLND